MGDVNLDAETGDPVAQTSDHKDRGWQKKLLDGRIGYSFICLVDCKGNSSC